MQRKPFTQERTRRKKNRFLPHFFILLAVVAVIVALSFGVSFLAHKRQHTVYTISALYEKWNARNYEEVYALSSGILNNHPLQNTARTFHGYSAFQLALSATDASKSQSYLDEALINLRIALQTARAETIPQICYMLGKTYFYKDNIANYHYYADLAVKYLLQSRLLGYEAKDIPEYLGLSYAALGETQKSIEAFGSALVVRESDTLFLSLAEQYYKMENFAATRSYLALVDKTSQNDELLARSHLLQGQMYLKEEQYSQAKEEFEAILEKNENSADAHYGLAVMYDKMGNIAKFRSELKLCLNILPNHAGALALAER